MKISNIKFTSLQKKTNETNVSSITSLNHTILSSNKVTGFSVNFPIGTTCQPSKVCIKTCYGLLGPITWPVSLKKQVKNLLLCKDSPKIFAQKISSEISKYKAKDDNFFLRWNGVGDLFKEAIDAIQELSTAEPDLPIWVVTRIPEHAAKLANLLLPNVYIHFSLDKKSLDRKKKVEKLLKVKTNLFYSYQCDKNEIYNPISFISVVFADKYDKNFINEIDETICPLNTNEDIEGMCNQCRRCFNNNAVNYQKISA
jgi:hypothetical protein